VSRAGAQFVIESSACELTKLVRNMYNFTGIACVAGRVRAEFVSAFEIDEV